MRMECQIECQNGCQKECQNIICQKEYNYIYICNISFQMVCKNLCRNPVGIVLFRVGITTEESQLYIFQARIGHQLDHQPKSAWLNHKSMVHWARPAPWPLASASPLLRAAAVPVASIGSAVFRCSQWRTMGFHWIRAITDTLLVN